MQRNHSYLALDHPQLRSVWRGQARLLPQLRGVLFRQCLDHLALMGLRSINSSKEQHQSFSKLVGQVWCHYRVYSAACRATGRMAQHETRAFTEFGDTAAEQVKLYLLVSLFISRSNFTLGHGSLAACPHGIIFSAHLQPK